MVPASVFLREFCAASNGATKLGTAEWVPGVGERLRYHPGAAGRGHGVGHSEGQRHLARIIHEGGAKRRQRNEFKSLLDISACNTVSSRSAPIAALPARGGAAAAFFLEA